MVMPIRKIILTCWLLFISCAVVWAAPLRRCAGCDKSLPEGASVWLLKPATALAEYYIETGVIHPDQTRLQKEADPTGQVPVGTYLYLCEECNKTKISCSLCGLPVREGFVETGDGRKICRREAADVVLDLETARQIFETGTRQARNVAGIDFGLKQPGITVQLVDMIDMAEKADGGHTLGFSKRSPTIHYVCLLSGQLKRAVITTSAHEYMHLWINENIGSRQIEKNTVEGICELLAYKVAQAEQDVFQQRQILTNTYTHGRIHDLIEVERQHGFYYILDWVKNGATRTFDETPAAVKKPMPVSSAPRPLPAASASSVAKPDTLKLKGMFTKRGSRLAILSDGVTVAKGEIATLRLNGLRVTLKCLDVLADSVVLQLVGATNSITLEME